MTGGLGLLAVVSVIAVAYAVVEFVGWRTFDRNRRVERTIRRNLDRATGAVAVVNNDCAYWLGYMLETVRISARAGDEFALQSLERFTLTSGFATEHDFERLFNIYLAKHSSFPVSGGALLADNAPAESHEPGADGYRAGTGNHSRRWSLPDVGGYELGDPKTHVLREAGELL